MLKQTVYKYDEKTKEYLGTTETMIDPLESKKQGRTIYLLPANSTFTKPKEEAPEGYANVWNGIVWKLIEDNRGKEYWLPEDVYNTPARVMEDLGPLPADAIFTAPEQTKEEKKNEKANSFRSNLRDIAINAMMATLAGNGIENAKTEYQTELQSMEDEVAVLVPDVFPLWSANSVEYKKGDRVTYNNVLYKVITAHTSQESWKPDVSPSLFAKVISQIGEEIPEWEQPSSTNPYMKGDKVKFKGKIYESLIDNNVWSPEGYPAGWKEIEEA